ncbi:MAG: mechanosensitive ion channel [Desulfobacterales bacterium]|nr:mechanosensitive ion channel [Desulfobacterales bacterium]
MKPIKTFILFFLVLSFFSLTAHSSPGPADNETNRAGQTAISTGDHSAQAVVATLTDEQVRRMLIQELKNQAPQIESSDPDNRNSRLVSFIHYFKNMVAGFQERMAFLRSGGSHEGEPQSSLFDYLAKDADHFDPMETLFSISAILMGAFLLDRLFFRYTRSFRTRLKTGRRLGLSGKLGNLSVAAAIDLISLLVFMAAGVLFFQLFFGGHSGLRLLLVTYIAAIVLTRITLIISRFLLSPKDPGLRILPMDSGLARYLHRWIAAIAFFASFGLLTCGIMRLSGSSEAGHITTISMIGLIISILLVVMILQKRKAVARALAEKSPPGSQREKLAQKWHHIAIFFVFSAFIASVKNMVMGTPGSYAGIKTLAVIPAYFLLDWILVNLLNLLFGFIPDDPVTDKDGPGMTAAGFNRIKQSLVPCLRAALAALVIFGILTFWGIELPVGRAVAEAAFNILAVVLVCFVVWEILNAAIQRRLKLEMPEDDEEMEEGGSGGSRVGTLLLLLRKFLLVFLLVIAVMIILSALGVNIAPLIAGAGVVGLAIGFGAQTLVKDIISGIFFLIDDAFRVGDFIEVGTTKGVVEQISIRSFKLRHPRGMVNTIPFGDISNVTNFSRDYIISKLDFRVRYDTDVEKVRKIVKKKVYKVILADKNLAPKLLGKIKSQGVRQLEDSAMIMRIKFKTIPGEQFSVRKEVFRLLQEAFQSEGIEFAHKNVTVYIPPENSGSKEVEKTGRKEERIKAAAAAALQETPQETKGLVNN